MKSRNSYYPDITSFSDFAVEKQRLIYRRKLTETKLNMNFHSMGRLFSFSNIFHTISRKVVLPQISNLLGILIDRMEKKSTSGEGPETSDKTL